MGSDSYTVRINKETNEMLEKIAEARGLSKSKTLHKIIIEEASIKRKERLRRYKEAGYLK